MAVSADMDEPEGQRFLCTLHGFNVSFEQAQQR
jgi:hypothetical protein